MYIIDGSKYRIYIGSRAEVWHGNAYKTAGGLIKKDLFKNKHGHIVSLKKSKTAKKDMRLLKHGYGFKQGEFGYVKVTPKRSTVKNRE
jgi:hypothetical protein